MTGRWIRISGQSEYYTFTYVSGTTGTLDRVYESDTETGLSYKISKSVYALPSDLRLLHSMRILTDPDDLDQSSQEELDETAPARESYGTPDRYALYANDASTPPVAQVELYPIPDAVIGIPYWYSQDPTLFAATATSSFIAPWLSPDAIYSGVEADALRKEKDYAGYDRAEAAYNNHLTEMFHGEATRMGARPLKMAPAYTRHNRQRTTRYGWPNEP
jgi:hypothetical protein